MRFTILAIALLFVVSSSVAKEQSIGDRNPFPPNYVPSGEVIYKQFCATCHGADAKGNGPTAAALKTPPPDLTKLAKKNLGKFPYQYVENVLRFGPGPSAHGSSDMPTWGPIFHFFDKNNERAVQQRIKNLCDYLASVQEK